MNRYVIRGGTVYDGLGGTPFEADVLVEGDEIVAVGQLPPHIDALTINAAGMAVCPGFINVLSHAWGSLQVDGSAASDLLQGVTTEVFGEAFTLGPSNSEFGVYLQGLLGNHPKVRLDFPRLSEGMAHLAGLGVAVNVASFIGATNLRFLGAGFADRPLTRNELDILSALAKEEMQDGALGLGTALIYPPGRFAVTEELIALSRVVAEHDGLYISHLRSEGDRLIESLHELLTIGQRAQVRTEVFHLKAAGKHNHHKMTQAVDLLNEQRAAGVEVGANMYPYTAGATHLMASIPPRHLQEGPDALIERLATPAFRRRIASEMSQPGRDFENLFLAADAGAGITFLSDLADGSRVQGKTLIEVAQAWNCSAPEAVMEALRRDPTAGVAYVLMSEENIHLGLSQPWVSIGSDGPAHPAAAPWTNDSAHPRTYGTFARALGHYGRDAGLFSLSEGIRRLTSLPATRFRLHSRGQIRAGFFADIVVFDPDTYCDNSTYVDPHRYATGVDTVMVNGTRVVESGQISSDRPGRHLQRGRR